MKPTGLRQARPDDRLGAIRGSRGTGLGGRNYRYFQLTRCACHRSYACCRRSQSLGPLPQNYAGGSPYLGTDRSLLGENAVEVLARDPKLASNAGDGRLADRGGGHPRAESHPDASVRARKTTRGDLLGSEFPRMAILLGFLGRAAILPPPNDTVGSRPAARRLPRARNTDR